MNPDPAKWYHTHVEEYAYQVRYETPDYYDLERMSDAELATWSYDQVRETAIALDHLAGTVHEAREVVGGCLYIMARWDTLSEAEREDERRIDTSNQRSMDRCYRDIMRQQRRLNSRLYVMRKQHASEEARVDEEDEA